MSHLGYEPKPRNILMALSDEEQRAPLTTVKRFFEDYTLTEVREINQEADHACLTTDVPPFDNPEDRDRLLCYRANSAKLIEAAFLLVHSHAIVPAGTAPDPEAPS